MVIPTREEHGAKKDDHLLDSGEETPRRNPLHPPGSSVQFYRFLDFKVLLMIPRGEKSMA